MIAYTVHEPTKITDPLARADAMAFVKEGFAWPALFFQLLWLLYHRMWWVVLGFLVVTIGLEVALSAYGLSDTGLAWVSLAVAVLFAFLANDLRRWSLRRRGYAMVGAVSGASREECERRFFSGWVKQPQAREMPAASKVSAGVTSRAATQAAQVVIVDYGSGNLHSAGKAFERAAREAGGGLTVKVSNDPEDVVRAERIVLPGVGAFADCFRGLRTVPGMLPALQEAVRAQGKPFLGICVGMQLMADRGLEHGESRGLGWISGEVCAIEPRDPALKIPHMGWNTLQVLNPHPLLAGIPTGPDGLHAYFVHSYHFVTTDPGAVVAETDYGGPVTAMVARDNMAGTQFHPEKSQKLGLALIANFLTWRP